MFSKKLEFFCELFFCFSSCIYTLSTVANSRHAILRTLIHFIYIISNIHDDLQILDVHDHVHGARDEYILRDDAAAHELENGRPPLYRPVPLLQRGI